MQERNARARGLTRRCSRRSRAALCEHSRIAFAASQLNARTLGLHPRIVFMAGSVSYLSECVGTALGLLLALAGCDQSRSSRRTELPDHAARGALVCDSNQVVRITLDSLARLDGFRSEVFRYEPDSMGFRIVTVPAPSARVLDGMAIVRVSRACRIENLTQTDSA